ncbi:hypothetical protein GA0061099_1004370 [Bradyrhizobium yuanmingense]|uniref:DUF2474 family protein n=1 Tax=Bradyrhizobium yuanmingense TaxID=108015 RepID=A0A1C3VPT0_9BRAD|nr:hypothetical protein IQ15_02129 [Bradyrhizobium yuanmingense]SCB29772.1 hypothetical protein GA0061099_1004370 [Bradyrhizobium yuanmingense]
MLRVSRAWRQLLWFVALWAAGVIALLAIAVPIRWLLKTG